MLIFSPLRNLGLSLVSIRTSLWSFNLHSLFLHTPFPPSFCLLIPNSVAYVLGFCYSSSYFQVAISLSFSHCCVTKHCRTLWLKTTLSYLSEFCSLSISSAGLGWDNIWSLIQLDSTILCIYPTWGLLLVDWAGGTICPHSHVWKLAQAITRAHDSLPHSLSLAGLTDLLPWQPRYRVEDKGRSCNPSWGWGSETYKVSLLPDALSPSKSRDQSLFKRARNRPHFWMWGVAKSYCKEVGIWG